MAYKLAYIIPFKSLRNDDIVVHILSESNLIEKPIELLAGDTPAIISGDDDDFLYTPSRKSTCKLKIVGSDYLQDLYSNSYQQWKVNIYRNNSIIWTGFITPENYTQDFTNNLIELDLEAKSALTVLENIEYTTKYKKWLTVWEYLANIIALSKADYTHIIVPDTYQLEEGNIFENMKISEYNFFDEEGEAMMALETLEELCKFLNWTVTDWNGSLTFVDVDYRGTYRKYNKDLTHFTLITPQEFSVQDLGFNGGNNTLDIIPGYTKARVKVSNYNVDELFKKLDFDDLKITKTEGEAMHKYATRWQFVENKTDIECYHYWDDSKPMSNEEYEASKRLSVILGAGTCNVFSYGTNYSSIRPEYDTKKVVYKPAIFVRTKTTKYPQDSMGTSKMFDLVDKPVIRYHAPEILHYTAGALCLKLGVEAITWYSNEKTFVVGEKTNGISGLKTMIRVGKYYWNGKGWTEKKVTFKLDLDTDSQTGFMQVVSNKVLFEGPNNADGYLFDLYSRTAPKNVSGDLELIIYSSNEHYTNKNVAGFHLADLSISFVPSVDCSSNNTQTDRIYENEINENLISKLDDIEVKISSHNQDGISRSKVLLNDAYITDNLYSRIASKDVRPEEQLITRIINQYSSAKIKLVQELEFKDLRPIDRLQDVYFKNKTFVITGLECNIVQNSMSVKMIEHE